MKLKPKKKPEKFVLDIFFQKSERWFIYFREMPDKAVTYLIRGFCMHLDTRVLEIDVPSLFPTLICNILVLSFLFLYFSAF